MSHSYFSTLFSRLNGLALFEIFLITPHLFHESISTSDPTGYTTTIPVQVITMSTCRMTSSSHHHIKISSFTTTFCLTFKITLESRGKEPRFTKKATGGSKRSPAFAKDAWFGVGRAALGSWTYPVTTVVFVPLHLMIQVHPSLISLPSRAAEMAIQIFRQSDADSHPPPPPPLLLETVFSSGSHGITQGNSE